MKCFLDSLSTVKLIKEGVNIHHREANEIKLIRDYLSRDWQVQVCHTWTEGNQCANFLAKMGVQVAAPMVVVHDPPRAMLYLLLVDAMGMFFPRG